MKCTQCGAQVEGDFCPYCGTAAEVKTQENNVQQPKVEMPKMSNNNENKAKKPFYKKWWVWVIAAIVIFGMIGKLGGNNGSSVDINEFEWNNITLAEILPEPESKLGSYLINTEDYFSVDVHEMSKDAYKGYVDGCREKGFTVEVSEYDGYYSASNEAGFELMLYYFDDEQKMSIDLTASSEIGKTEDKEGEPNESEVAVSETSTPKEPTLIDNFVTAFNKLSETPITERASFEPTDRESGYYRNEYRLDDWDGSIGEVGKIGENTIEITNYGLCGGFYDENDDLRVYVTADTTEEILKIFPLVAKAMDSTVTDEEIQEVIDYVNEWGDKNGLYIGELSGLILSKQNYTELMLDLS